MAQQQETPPRHVLFRGLDRDGFEYTLVGEQPPLFKILNVLHPGRTIGYLQIANNRVANTSNLAANIRALVANTRNTTEIEVLGGFHKIYIFFREISISRQVYLLKRFNFQTV